MRHFYFAASVLCFCSMVIYLDLLVGLLCSSAICLAVGLSIKPVERDYKNAYLTLMDYLNEANQAAIFMHDLNPHHPYGINPYDEEDFEEDDEDEDPGDWWRKHRPSTN